MTEIYGIYATLLLISTIITLYLAFYSWNKRLNRDAFYFSFLMVAVSIWTITGSFEMASISIATKIIFAQLSYIGIVLIGPFLVFFTMSYTANDKWLQNKLIGLLLIIPIITLIFVATNGWYGLIWPTITPSSNQPGSILIYGHGLGFYLNTLYTYILLFLSILLLIQSLVRSPKIYQNQILIILISTLIPLIANAIYITQSSPIPGLDLTPFAFTLTGILVAYSIFKYKLLEIVPVAYNKLFDKMSSGAMVIDSNKMIIDVNSAAEHILQVDHKIIGTYIEESLDHFNILYPLDEIKKESKMEIEIGQSPKIWLDIQITPLDKNNHIFGWLITFIDISARKIAEILLKKSEKEYRNLVDNALVGIYKSNLNGKILFANDALANIFGYNNKNEMDKLQIQMFYKNEVDRDKIINKLKKEGKIERYEVELIKKDGTEIYAILSSIIDGNNMSGMIMDITENKKAEEQIKSSLHDKEMLIKEIHHRVKNNLMVISSLLNLQSRYIKDEASKNIFKESQNRARSMAIIHELLYQSTDLKRINFGFYIKNLVRELSKMYLSDQNLIKMNIHAEDVMVDINTAIPLGLIVNELVSNSMKHGFSEGVSGEITIVFKRVDDNYFLVVEDNGVGFPEDVDFKHSNSLGLRIVNSLTEQIEGEIKLERINGSKFTIKFKEEDFENSDMS
jgi:PAS domain S-box-containing protein